MLSRLRDLLYLLTMSGELRSGCRHAQSRPIFARSIASIALVLLVGYWALMKFVPVPGYGAGHLGKDDNLGAYIDRTVMGGHLWSESMTWDPEGFLSTLPAIATLLIGILAGEWLRSDRARHAQGRWAGGCGLVLLIAGACRIPIFRSTKICGPARLCCLHGGFAMLVLSACYWVVDVARMAEMGAGRSWFSG